MLFKFKKIFFSNFLFLIMSCLFFPSIYSMGKDQVSAEITKSFSEVMGFANPANGILTGQNKAIFDFIQEESKGLLKIIPLKSFKNNNEDLKSFATLFVDQILKKINERFGSVQNVATSSSSSSNILVGANAFRLNDFDKNNLVILVKSIIKKAIQPKKNGQFCEVMKATFWVTAMIFVTCIIHQVIFNPMIAKTLFVACLPFCIILTYLGIWGLAEKWFPEKIKPSRVCLNLCKACKCYKCCCCCCSKDKKK